jgi:hypothetical protein
MAITSTVSLRLIAVGWILVLMANLFLLSESFPLILLLSRLILPLFSDDLGNLWICEARMFSNHGGLMVLSIQDECCVR